MSRSIIGRLPKFDVQNLTVDSLKTLLSDNNIRVRDEFLKDFDLDGFKSFLDNDKIKLREPSQAEIIEAMNRAGAAVWGDYSESALPETPHDLSAAVDQSRKQIELSWKFKKYSNIKFEIYRAVQGNSRSTVRPGTGRLTASGKFTSISQRLPSASALKRLKFERIDVMIVRSPVQQSFSTIDMNDLVEGNTYIYKVRAYVNDGNYGKFSEECKVVFSGDTLTVPVLNASVDPVYKQLVIKWNHQENALSEKIYILTGHSTVIDGVDIPVQISNSFVKDNAGHDLSLSHDGIIFTLTDRTEFKLNEDIHICMCAENEWGNSGPSEMVTVNYHGEYPFEDSDLSASVDQCYKRFYIRWHNVVNALEYQVSRRDTVSGKVAVLNERSIFDEENNFNFMFDDSSELQMNRKYQYCLSAANEWYSFGDVGYIAYTDTLLFKASAPVISDFTAVQEGKKVHVGWACENADSYTLSRKISDKKAGGSNASFPLAGTRDCYDDWAVDQTRSYEYQLQAVNEWGTSYSNGMNVSIVDKVVRTKGVIITTIKYYSHWYEYAKKEDEKRRRKKNRYYMRRLFKLHGIDTTEIVDEKYSVIKEEIRKIFKDTDADDISYIYINCHGGLYSNMTDGTGFLHLGYNGKNNDEAGEINIGFRTLKLLLDEIPGKKVLMIDACHSGSAVKNTRALIPQTKDNADISEEFMTGFVSEFASKPKSSMLRSMEFAAPDYYVLCSARYDENAVGDSVKGNWATRYWACGGGYDFIKGCDDDLEADSNKDKKVSLKELYDYTNKKLKKWSRGQRCVCYPEDCDDIIFY